MTWFRRRARSSRDLRTERNWSIAVTVYWLGWAALRMSETGNRPILSFWLALVGALTFAGNAVYCQIRLRQLRHGA
ncbi:hypothetical protein [Arthrobacter sp. GMC3]|uniref:hypothetical protein n=1 Tax=Arthrobacter sp. GMC3 TaxID=2058894 RepID=UPI0011B0A500|nr:hypothetical protein [Arthrobacter sp. GMC3]